MAKGTSKAQRVEKPAEFQSGITVILDGERPVRASLRDGQLECPANFALRAYLAAALVHLAANLTAKGST